MSDHRRARTKDMAAVVRYWRSVEMLTPPSIEPPDPKEYMYRARPDGLLPWEDGHPHRRIQLGPTNEWRFDVYCGVYPLDDVKRVLTTVFGEDPESHDARSNGDSALAAFALDNAGFVLGGSQVLSSCAWATGRAIDPGPTSAGWIDGFTAATGSFDLDFAEFFAHRFRQVADDATTDDDHRRVEPAPVGDDLLQRFVATLAAGLGLTGRVGAVGYRIKATKVAKRRATDDDELADPPAFLNSFIADDLALIAKSVPTGRLGGALARYLSIPQSSGRVDLREHDGFALEHVTPPGDAVRPVAV